MYGRRAQKIKIPNEDEEVNNNYLVDKKKNELSVDPKRFGIWDPTTLKNNFAMVILGRRGTGKTFILKDILNKLKDRFDEAYLFSQTSDIQPIEAYGFIPEENQYNNFDVEVISSIYKRQEDRKRRNRRMDGIMKEKDNHILIVFDDMINDPRLRGSEWISKIFVS